MKHYSKEELEMFRHKEMSVLGRIACSAHLRECPKCAKRLAELTEEDRLLFDLRNSVKLFRELSK